jgi:hypothetical protein
MEDKELDVDMCRMGTDMFACRVDLIDLFQECCPSNDVTKWLLRALTRPGEIEGENAILTFAHKETSVDVRAIPTEYGTYLHLEDFMVLVKEMRKSLREQAKILPEDTQDRMLLEVTETFDVLDNIMGSLEKTLDEFFED